MKLNILMMKQDIHAGAKFQNINFMKNHAKIIHTILWNALTSEEVQYDFENVLAKGR